MSGLSGSRFTPQGQSTHDRLSNNTVGLVALSDFRKRRAEVLEQQEREAREIREAQEAARARAAPADADGGSSGPGTGTEDDSAPKKKKTKKPRRDKKKGVRVSKLSFMGEDDDDDEGGEEEEKEEKEERETDRAAERATSTAVLPPPKSFTKQALRRQAAEREALRKEFLQLQAAVKATEIAIPFVFYEGANIPGGVVKVRKGDFVWVFLDKSRKVGARLGVGEKKPSKARLHWARVGVDDLMLVRGTLILPHHYDFYFFIINKTLGPGGARVFDYSDKAPQESTKPADAGEKASATLVTPAAGAVAAAAASDAPDEDYSMLEGASDDPGLTKVVDRRWYERNKHIYPANVWQEFDPEQDYTQQVRRDQGGNAYFAAN